MGIWRKWVFPILRLTVFVVIAVALVKLAFFADPTESDGPATPTGSVTDPQVTAILGTIINDVTLDGTVSADPAVPVRATGAGTVDEIFLQQGATVASGDKIFDIKVETLQDPIEKTDAEGNVSVVQPKPVITYSKVYASAAGVLSSLTVLQGQSVAIGDAAGQIAPPTFSVSGSLSPEQQYRLLDQPTEAMVTITGGPAPFTCTGLAIAAPLAGEGDAGSGDGAGAGTTSTATVRCAVPADVKVFPGLTAIITIPAGSAENVLTIPTTAVEGGAQTGVVYAVLEDGSTEQRDVTLGLTDGAMVEVTGGLDEGQAILQFTPNAQAPVDDGCTYDAAGNIIGCGG